MMKDVGVSGCLIYQWQEFPGSCGVGLWGFDRKHCGAISGEYCKGLTVATVTVEVFSSEGCQGLQKVFITCLTIGTEYFDFAVFSYWVCNFRF